MDVGEVGVLVAEDSVNIGKGVTEMNSGQADRTDNEGGESGQAGS
jgi:hypothetical protein